MTGNEIIKVLEKSIPVAIEQGEEAVAQILKNAVDLINRQKAEIGTLKAELKFYKDNYLLLAEEWQRYPYKTAVGNNSEIHSKSAKDYDKLISNIKSEAIKKFEVGVKPILREMFCLMIDDDEGKCIIEDCKKHSSIPCMNEYCIKENLVAWETKIDNLVKEMTEGQDNA